MRAIESQLDATHVTSSNIAAGIGDEQPRFTRRETLLTMLGVLMVMLLASLDQTIPCQNRSFPLLAISTRSL
jgi:hypothetical protein